ncbi:MAG: hypothetical protein WC911_01700 [Thermoleophilia bacterium]
MTREKCYCGICEKDVPANIDGTPKKHTRDVKTDGGWAFDDCPGGSYDLRPILMDDRMALLTWTGEKSQTRRAVKPPKIPFTKPVEDWQARAYPDGPSLFGACYLHIPYQDDTVHRAHCPYGGVGDRLYVRETWRPALVGDVGICYRATSDPTDYRPWKPSIHMPFKAVRSILEITEIRLERVKDISAKDLLAEGFTEPADYLAYFDSPLEWVWAIGFRRIER